MSHISHSNSWWLLLGKFCLKVARNCSFPKIYLSQTLLPSSLQLRRCLLSYTWVLKEIVWLFFFNITSKLEKIKPRFTSLPSSCTSCAWGLIQRVFYWQNMKSWNLIGDFSLVKLMWGNDCLGRQSFCTQPTEPFWRLFKAEAELKVASGSSLTCVGILSLPPAVEYGPQSHFRFPLALSVTWRWVNTFLFQLLINEIRQNCDNFDSVIAITFTLTI